VHDGQLPPVEERARVVGAPQRLLPVRDLLLELAHGRLLRERARDKGEVLADVAQRFERLRRLEHPLRRLQPEVLDGPHLELRRVLLGLSRGEHVGEGGERLDQLRAARANRLDEEAVQLLLLLAVRAELGIAIGVLRGAELRDGLVIHRLVLHIFDGELHAIPLQRLPGCARGHHRERPVNVCELTAPRVLSKHCVRAREEH